MTLKFPALFVFLVFFSLRGFSQIVVVSGVISEKSGSTLPGASIKVMKPDSSFVTGTTTDADGAFSLSLPAGSKFILLFSYLSYRDTYRAIQTTSEPLGMGKITLREDAQTLSEVEIKTTQVRGEQKGDTTQFNADAFKTNPDATAEDLVKKMPGVTSDNNGIKVNGESVQKILVDGKPFFGDDPNAALKNLPADLIDKVEVFDKMSDQSQFTGFNDGDQQKTINIVTKKGKNVGQFGKIYGAAGADEDLNARYNAGAAINSFNNKRRVSLLLLSNNINQQNFSISDITGAMGTSGSNAGRGGGGGGQGGGTLLTAPQNGNTTTQSAGLNFSDSWGKKINISGSYFFNYTDNKNKSEISRNYFTGDSLVYRQSNNNQGINQNHRVNVRFEYNIDSANKLTIVPSFNAQNNDAKVSLLASNSVLDNIIKSTTNTRSDIKNLGYDFNNNILFQHKFRKKGRTVSLGVNTQLGERNNDGSYNSYSIFEDSLALRDQVFDTYSYNKKTSVNLSYTEPLSKYAQMQISYNPSYTTAQSNKRTNDLDTISDQYTSFNTALSNKYNNTYMTQRGGLGYKYQKEKLNVSFGVDAQTSQLKGEQTFPLLFTINKSFQNILPNAMLNYKFSKSRNLRVNYRTSTNIPGISQLQNVIDISNPLLLKSGNSDLKQTFENNLNLRFGGFNSVTARNAMIFLNASYTDNYISNATYLLRTDSVIQGVPVSGGSQLTKPVNLNGYYTARMFFVYGFPLKAIKSNVNVNGGINYGHTPSIINAMVNKSNSYALNGGAFIGSNISDKLDFSIGYNAGYTIVKNDVQKQSDNNFFNQTTTFKINWIFWKGFVLNTDFNQTLYNGLTQNYNQQYFLWNAYIGYKFLKNNALEAKISIFDILNQNRSIGRNVTGSYTEDYNTTVLRRYALFTLTYTLKNFKAGSTAPKTDESQNPFPGGPPPGMRPPMGNPGGGQ